MTARRLASALAVPVLLLALAALGCTEKLPAPTTPPAPTGPPVMPDSIQAIFNSRCVGCHSGGAPSGGLDLSAAVSYDNTINRPSTRCAPLDLIEPFDPAASCLVRRIEGTVTPRMPLGTSALSAADIARIRSWISQGAPGTVTAPALRASRTPGR